MTEWYWQWGGWILVALAGWVGFFLQMRIALKALKQMEEAGAITRGLLLRIPLLERRSVTKTTTRKAPEEE